MPNVTYSIAQALARRSSRRQFFKLIGASSLGAGLALTHTDVALAGFNCVGCGGGPCNPCYSPAPNCNGTACPCRTCAGGGGCGSGCITLGEWYCCSTSTGCRIRCSECNCPCGCCHCFISTGRQCTSPIICRGCP